MKIAVFGAGGVGAFFGGLLVRGGQDVHFVARGAQLDALRTGGIRIESTLLGDVHVPVVHAVAAASEVGKVDLVLVCVKAHQTPAIADDLSTLLHDDTAIVTLQNGVESDAMLAAAIRPELASTRQWSTSAPPSSVLEWSVMWRRAPLRLAPVPEATHHVYRDSATCLQPRVSRFASRRTCGAIAGEN